MRILITGATGFLGGAVLERLADKYGPGQVSGTGRNPGSCRLLRDKGFNIIEGDLSDLHFVERDLSSFTHIVHCAARAALWGRYNDFYRDNVLATTNIIKGISSLRRIVYISTGGIYFNNRDRIAVKEDDLLPAKFATPYAETKYLGERVVLDASGKDISGIVIRPRSIIGPGDTVVMPRVLEAYNRGRLFLVGRGKSISDFTSVSNLVSAVDLALNSGAGANGQVFNISDGTGHMLGDIIRDVLEALRLGSNLRMIPYPVAWIAGLAGEIAALATKDKIPVISRYNINQLSRSMTLDTGKATRILGYKQIKTTNETLADFARWYRSTTKI